jgi:DNA repair protein RadC
VRNKILRLLAITSVSILALISPCLAERDSYSYEENRIRNKSRECEVIIYYKDGEKIKSEYLEGEKHAVKYSSKDTLKEAKELNADKVVFIHNHPGGNIAVSPKDYKQKEITDKKFDKVKIETEHIVVTRNKEKKY